MATYDVTGPGGTNRPSRRNPGVRVPYLIENTIDVSAINGDSGAAQNDTLDVLVLSAASTAGKIRVWAMLCDVAGVDENDRQSDAQHDTAQ